MVSEELLGKRDVAKRCGVAPRTLDSWITSKRIPYVKFGKLVRFIPADLDKFIAAHRIGR